MHTAISAEIINYIGTIYIYMHAAAVSSSCILTSSLHQMHFVHEHNAAARGSNEQLHTLNDIHCTNCYTHSHFVDWCMYTTGAAAVQQS